MFLDSFSSFLSNLETILNLIKLAEINFEAISSGALPGQSNHTRELRYCKNLHLSFLHTHSLATSLGSPVQQFVNTYVSQSHSSDSTVQTEHQNGEER